MKRINKKSGLYILSVLLLLISVSQVRNVNAADGQLIADGMYKLISAIDNKFVWDIADASNEDGANLQLYTDNNSNAQKFIVTYAGDGYYTIKNVSSGKAIESVSDDADGTVNIQQNAENNADAQKWKIVSAEDGYYKLICKYNEQAVDVTNGIAADGANIQTYEVNNTLAQLFKFAETVKVESPSITKQSKGFFTGVTFLLLGLEAIIVFGIAYYFQVAVKKRED